MTNEELLATAEVATIRALKNGKDTVDLQRAINTLEFCIKSENQESIDFARAVLLTEIEELKG